MSGILSWIRSWLERKLGQDLQSLKGGFLTCGENQQQGPMLERQVLETKFSGFMGIMPVFRLRRVGMVTFSDAIKSSIRAAMDTLGRELKGIPQAVRTSAGSGLKTDMEKPLGQVRAKVGAEAERRMSAFDEKYLAGLIKADRNGFRQKLLEELGKQAAQIFAVAIKKHLAELVLRIRQEASEDGSSEPASGAADSLALPTGTRFAVRKGKMTIFVVEQPPQKRTIRVMEDHGDRSDLVELALPYVVFFIVLRGRKSDKAYVLFRNAPLRDMKDALLCPALPNVHGDFRICFAPSAAKESLAEMAEESVASFWGGRFIRTEILTEAHHRLGIESWAQGSKRDALFGLSHPWIPAKETVASMVKKISAEFVADTVAQRHARTGKDVMSALDAVVAQLATRIENEMKETCFRLVPAWNIDPAVLSQANADFKLAATELCAFAKTQLGEQVDGTLSDEVLQKALEAAVQRTLTSMKVDADKQMAAARKAFTECLKKEDVK